MNQACVRRRRPASAGTLSRRSTPLQNDCRARIFRAIGAVSLGATLAVAASAALAGPGLTIDLTTSSGGKTATASVGDTLTLNVYGVVTGADGTGANDGIQAAQGSFLSTGSMLGTLSATLVNPFTATGSQTGAQFDGNTGPDLDGDGDFDVGSNNNGDIAGFWAARSSSPQSPNGYTPPDPAPPISPSSFGTVEGASYRVQLGTLSFTVGSIGTADINFRPRSSTTAALWLQDTLSPSKNPANGTFSFGSPVTISSGPPTREWILNSNTGATWSTAANWSPAGAPDAAGAVANFLSAGAAGGDRTITVDGTRTVGAINFNPAANSYTLAGAGTLVLDTISGNASIHASSGNDSISAGIQLNRDADLTVDSTLALEGALNNSGGHTIHKLGSGTLTISGSQTHGAGAVLLTSAGTLNVNSDAGNPAAATGASSGGKLLINANAATNFGSTQHLAALGVSGHAAVAAGGARVLNVDSLAIAGSTGAWSGRLDLADNDLIVHADAGTAAAATAQIADQIKSGLNLGGTLWAGNGITTSAGGNGSGSFGALGMLHNDFADLGKPAGPIYTSFSGEPVDENAVLVKFTYFGDSDLDGSVTTNDYFQIDNGFLGSRTGWINGDFDYDGAVTTNDYFLIDNAFLGQGSALVPTGLVSQGISGVSAVPEPTATGLLMLAGAAGLLIRRRKVKHLGGISACHVWIL